MSFSIRIWKPREICANVKSTCKVTVAADVTCDTFMLSKGQCCNLPNNLSQHCSPFYLPANCEKYLCGMLSRCIDGQLVFGASAYLGGGHHVIAYALEQVYGAGAAHIWGGEIKVCNDREIPAVGSVVRVNNTSSFMYEHPLAANDSRSIERFLDDGVLVPFNRADCTTYEEFDENAPHLDTELNAVSDQGNIRHLFASKVGALQMAMCFLDERGKNARTYFVTRKKSLIDYLYGIAQMVKKYSSVQPEGIEHILSFEELCRVPENEFAATMQKYSNALDNVKALFGRPQRELLGSVHYEPPVGVYDLFELTG